MKKRTKIFGIAIIVIILLYAFVKLISMVASRPHDHVEEYEYKVSEKELIDRIIAFKKENPQYNVPKETNLEDAYGDTIVTKYYHVYIYFPAENKIVYFFITNDLEDKNISSLNLYSINDGLQLGHWRDVNKQLGFKENREIKRKFQERVLDKLGLAYKDKLNILSRLF